MYIVKIINHDDEIESIEFYDDQFSARKAACINILDQMYDVYEDFIEDEDCENLDILTKINSLINAGSYSKAITAWNASKILNEVIVKRIFPSKKKLEIKPFPVNTFVLKK